jgi:hypothetical protein
MMVRRRLRPQDYYTIAEANAALPLVRAIAADLSALSGDVNDRRRRVSALLDNRKPEPNNPYHEELDQVQRDLDHDAGRVQELIEELRQLGVEPSASRDGTVDFPSLIAGQKALLCWRLGEPDVRFWHRWDEPCTRRRRLSEAACKNTPMV